MRLVQKLATRPLVISWDSTIQSCFGRTLLPVRLHTPSAVPAAKMACWALKHDNPMILMAIVLNRSKLGWGISRALIVLPCCYPLTLLRGLNWEVTAIRMDGYNTDLNLRCNLRSSSLHEHDNFILIIGTMLRQNKVNPKHTITLTNIGVENKPWSRSWRTRCPQPKSLTCHILTLTWTKSICQCISVDATWILSVCCWRSSDKASIWTLSGLAQWCANKRNQTDARPHVLVYRISNSKWSALLWQGWYKWN